MAVKVGEKIEELILFDQLNKKFNLSEFNGKKVLLSFHPLAWPRSALNR